MQSMPSFFSGAIRIVINFVRKTTTKGMRKPFWFFSMLILTLFSFQIMRLWTYVPTYTHLVGVFAPLAKDTTNSHFVTAEIQISKRDAFSFSEIEEEPYLFYHSCAFRYEKKMKVKGVRLAAPMTPNSLDESWGGQVFNGMPEKTYDVNRITNMGIFVHAFNSFASNKINRQPLELNEKIETVGGSKSYQYFLMGIADPSLFDLPAFRICRERLSNPYFEKESGELIPMLVQMASDSLSSLCKIANYVKVEKESRLKKWIENYTRFFTFHNLAVSNYVIYCVSDGVDSISLRFSTTENSEFSLGMESDIEKGRNYITKVWEGDVINAKEISKLLTTTVRLQESENAQQVRMFIITTICATCFGFLLKYLMDYLFLFFIFIHKLAKNENKR